MSKEIEQKSKCCEKCVVKIQYGDWGCENSDCSCHLEQNNSWEEEFDEFSLCKSWELGETDFYIECPAEELKEFIRKHISHQKQLSYNEALEKVGEKIEKTERYDLDGYPEEGYYISEDKDGEYIKRELALSIIEKLKK